MQILNTKLIIKKTCAIIHLHAWMQSFCDTEQNISQLANMAS